MKRLALNEELARYVRNAHSAAGDPLLVELREVTARFGADAVMQIPDHQGTFLTLITKLVGAKTALEIGTFTGHSSICIARGLPPEGRLLCLDMSRQWTDVAREFWHKAGVASKIELQLGEALESLAALDPSVTFDLVHIDAEKTLYDEFFEAAFPLVPPGGAFLFDNMLRGGRVVQSPADEQTESIKALNEKLASDPRVETVLIEIGDGVQLCRKV